MSKPIIGQLTDEEFKTMLRPGCYNVDYVNKTAWLRYGKNTTNYYIQHEDGSWTNSHCSTK